MEHSTHYYENRDQVFYVGLGAIVISFLCFLYAYNNSYNENSTWFFIGINYLTSSFYLLLIINQNYKRNQYFFRQINRYHYICFLTLATISCLTLNLNINVFDRFSTWVFTYMGIMYGGLLGFCFLDKLPRWARVAIFFSLGMGTALATYFTVFLLPLMPFGLILCFVLGFSLHLIVPLLVLIASCSIFMRTEKSSTEKTAYWLGFSSPIALASIFVLLWINTQQLIHKVHQQNQAQHSHSLPNWVVLSQQLSDGFFTQRILKGEIVYTSFYSNSWRFASNSFEEKKEHDPLVAIATALTGSLPISKEDRIQILKFYSQHRHDAHRKLWSGQHLSTSEIHNTVQLYPEYRLAYLEKVIHIKNNSQQSWRTEEALYSFQLPEGSVATSLSLWIDGKEEPSRLTTRSKADSAYRTIVGIERRDPALLHWQEGNQVTVTVFPCTNKEERIFKIGITCPMMLTQDELILPPIEIEGPPVSLVKQSTKIVFPTQKKLSYTTDSQGAIHCPKVALSQQHFKFGQQRFWASPYKASLMHFAPQKIYLDVNKSWSLTEFEQICTTFASKEVYLYYKDSLYQIDQQDTELFEQARQLNFSLFPIDLIQANAEALIISKSPSKSPNLSDLKKTSFGQTMTTTLDKHQTPIPFFNLSTTLSPYLQSLKEFYVFNYSQGSLEQLQQLVQQEQFPALSSSNNAVVLHQSKMVLFCQQDNSPSASLAPDHLMRLFSYNQILKKIGLGYFFSGYENDELVQIAQQAHIVSPISSMIVLETKKDYERFDIKETEDGLGNASSLNQASQDNSGAVPEPHEWVFIILIGLGIIGLKTRTYFKA